VQNAELRLLVSGTGNIGDLYIINKPQ